MTGTPDEDPPAPPSGSNRWSAARILGLWFGVSQSVNRRAYAASGLILAGLKYTVETMFVYAYTARVYQPWDFVNPLLTARTDLLEPGPEWLPWAMFLWTLPFLWIAISMSVRRVADAGGSPWLGFLVLVPLANLALMFSLCQVRSRPHSLWATNDRPACDTARMHRALLAICASLVLGGLMLWCSVYFLSSYGASLFMGTPLLMGALAGYIYNRPQPRSYGQSSAVGLLAVLVAAAALLLFALEGVICIAMAAPLMLPLGALGGLLGKAIADATGRPRGGLVATALLLPVLAAGESVWTAPRDYVVLSSVEIDAPPELVWNHVLSFPELPPASEWYFRSGISCPQRARIVGNGPGATRYCEFTTGTFVEPITVWDAPRRLAFDVSEQPAPMFELSPYHDLHPPHLDGYLRSTRGEFLLIPLPQGRTRLEGRTWYTLELRPHDYWMWWSSGLIHRIHERVLVHIKQLSEAPRD